MKLTITLKDPDGFHEFVSENSEAECPRCGQENEDAQEALWDKLEKWVEFREYIYLEYDDEKGTLKVQERG